ncbi:MAG: protease complex subunit PrcB family protein [Halanaerobiales bacterium]|nr:protease complex subunit PrcB family protein [Halanaerobiales bacterium]
MCKISFSEIEDVRNLLKEDYLCENKGDHWVLTLGRGECRSGGYDILLKDISFENGILKAIVSKKDPKPGAFVTMALTYPTRQYSFEITEVLVQVIFESELGNILKTINI